MSLAPVSAAVISPQTTRSAASPARRRIIAAVVMLCAGGLLGVAAWLKPSPTGLGTHEQLFMPRCGWVMFMDCPCPTCGMTTAFAHAADGNLVASFRAQPLGCALAVATAMAFLIGAHVTITGSRVGAMLVRLWSARAGWVLAGLVLFAWLYKIASYKGWIG